MPYITEAQKLELDEGDREPESVGELTYVLTRVVDYYAKNPNLNGLRFQRIAEVLGALEATKAEFYRRVVVPYEDQKCAENGDVYLDL